MPGVALEYIGLVTELAVKDSFESTRSIAYVRVYIGDAIPDPGRSLAYGEAARRQFKPRAP